MAVHQHFKNRRSLRAGGLLIVMMTVASSGIASAAATAPTMPTSQPARPLLQPMVFIAPKSSGAEAPTGTSCAQARATDAADAAAGGVSFAEVAKAYDIDPLYRSGDLGQGVTIALVEFADFRPRDVQVFRGCVGAHTSVSTVLVDGGPPPSSGQAGLTGQLEADMDVEEVSALVPRAHIVVVEGNDTSANGILDTYSAAVASGAEVLSTSWGSCERAVPPSFALSEGLIFQHAATLGVTVVAAAGDAGSEDCYNGDASSAGLAVDDPASQPDVTAVGGTSFTRTAPTRRSEAVWNEGISGGAGGGGLSAFWRIPDYQLPDAAPALARATVGSCAVGQGGCRAVPDVSADAGTPLTFYCTERGLCDHWSLQAGTSVAGPMWASIFALADANEACHGVPLGFVNPALYAIADSAGYASAFTDIVSGDNHLAPRAGAFAAAPGYDLASGLGTPIAGNGRDGRLVAQLCSAPRGAAPTPQPITS